MKRRAEVQGSSVVAASVEVQPAPIWASRAEQFPTIGSDRPPTKCIFRCSKTG